MHDDNLKLIDSAMWGCVVGCLLAFQGTRCLRNVGNYTPNDTTI